MSDKQTEEQRLNPETAPDPEEDDLSDLDDMLDDFSSANISASKPTATSATTAAPPLPTAPKPVAKEDPISDDDFARQMQASMAGLLGQLDNNPDMQREFEDMMKDLGATGESLDQGANNGNQDLEEMMKQLMAGFDPTAITGATSGLAPASPTPAATTTAAATVPSPAAAAAESKSTPTTSKKPAESSFQDTIRKTMERMQTSGDTASAATAGSGEDDILAQMLKEMENGDFGAGGNEEDLNKMLMGMMEQLTNKDILYDPMKELHDKFPAWLRENKDKTSKDDLARYAEQQQVVGEIVARFERKQYSDDSSADREYIVERMQKMQAAGSPPPDLVGDMSSAQEALGDLEGGCPQQ